MAAGETCAANLADTVHHEMDSMIPNHRFINLYGRQ